MNKKNLLAVTITLLSVLLFTSCKKSSLSTNNNNNNNNSSGSLLTKFIQLDTLHASGQDTVYRVDYQYDNSKRLISMTNQVFDSVGVVLNTNITNYFYAGASTTPFKFVSYDPTLIADSSVSFLTYDNNNLNHVVELDYPNSSGDSTVSTVINSSTISSITNTYNGGVIDLSAADTAFYQSTSSGGNVTAAISNDGEIFDYSNITYDSHENPFTSIFIAQVLNGPGAENGYYGGGFSTSAHNVTSYSAVHTDSFTGTISYTYSTSTFSYNSNDYPISYRYISYDDNNIGVKDAGIRYFYYAN